MIFFFLIVNGVVNRSNNLEEKNNKNKICSAKMTINQI